MIDPSTGAAYARGTSPLDHVIDHIALIIDVAIQVATARMTNPNSHPMTTTHSALKSRCSTPNKLYQTNTVHALHRIKCLYN